MRPGFDPKVDFIFKRLFGSEDTRHLLIHLLNAVAQYSPIRQVTGVDLLNPFNEKEHPDDKLSVVDVKARDQSGRQFHVEMQTTVPWFIPNRLLYYWSRLHQQQVLAGDYFQTLRPTISICFVDGVLFENAPGHHHVFRLRSDGQVTLTDALEIHIVELPRFTLTAEQLSTPLDLWCFFLRHGEQLDDDSLPPPLNVPPIRLAMEVLKMLSQNDLERERYEAALKVRRDNASLLEEARRSKEDLRRTEDELSRARIRLEESTRGRIEELRQAEEEMRRFRIQTEEKMRQSEESLRQVMHEADRQVREIEENSRREQEAPARLAHERRIHLCQRLLSQPLTPREELQSLSLDEMAQRADELEKQLPVPS